MRIFYWQFQSEKLLQQVTTATQGFLGCRVNSFIVFYPVGKLKASVRLSMMALGVNKFAQQILDYNLQRKEQQRVLKDKHFIANAIKLNQQNTQIQIECFPLSTSQNQIQITQIIPNLKLKIKGSRLKIFNKASSPQSQMDSNTGEDSIQVFIRIKPILQQQGILTFTENQIRLDKHQFAFDRIFPPSSTQNEIFHLVGSKLLNNILDGYNSCVFAYGQTGSGKTHTMIGENNGLMQQSFNQLFSRINRLKNAQCLVTCSYFQLYNEQIMDLLQPKKEKKLNIRQDVKRGVFVENLTEQTALDCDKLMEVLYTGMKNRHIGQTQMNRQSSRSHSVFTISLSCKVEEEGKKILKTPKLHFVDLAGAQKQKMTQASGDRLKEASNINKSLTTLGMVINALTSEKPRSHIPYRDSKLTCLLRDSLGGNSKTIIIATVSSLALSFQETLSTLNFANRAKMVKVKALINEQSLSNSIQVFKEQIRRLKTEIMRLKTEQHRTPAKVVEMVSPKQISNQLQHHFDEINKKISVISEQLSQGITSPSLQALLNNLNGKNSLQIINNITSTEHITEAQMEEEHPNSTLDQMSEATQKYSPSEFIEYLNSNYQLLSEINTKINQYVELKQQLRQTALSKKLEIQSLLTPSKFERTQYEQLLTKRQKQIKELEQKLQKLQNDFSLSVLQQKELSNKLELYQQKKISTTEELEKLRYDLIQRQFQFEREKCQNLKIKTQIDRIEKINLQLQTRYNETKELHLYAEEKYENQKIDHQKLSQKLQQAQREIQNQKKLCQFLKTQKLELQNKIQNLAINLEDKESKQQQLKNELNQMEQTLDFNKKIIEDINKKNISLITEIQKNKLAIQDFTLKINELNREKLILSQKIIEDSSLFTCQLDQSAFEHKKSQITIQKLTHELFQLEQDHQTQKQIKQEEFQKAKENISQLNKLMNEKQSQIARLLTEKQLLKDSVQKIQNQKELTLQNYFLKYQAKVVEYNMLEETFKNHQNQNQNFIEQLKKQQEFNQTKIKLINDQNQTLTEKINQSQTKLIEAEKKLSQVKNVFDENQQLRKTYKELVKQNYRLKGKYQSTSQNEDLEKLKNDELFSKVEFYEQKFKLMSIEYHKFESIVKKLKQKELQANKKIQFYEESIRLMQIDRLSSEDSEQKNQLVCELKQQNKELKCKLDQIQSNLIYSEKLNQNNTFDTKKNIKHGKQTIPLKYDKFRARLAQLMKNWENFPSANSQNISTEEMIDLCEVMLNENAIKFETISKGIRRQQKLKSQNHFILKENIYLKEKLEQLDKSQPPQGPKPRKTIKLQ